jgi:hypothetical protein
VAPYPPPVVPGDVAPSPPLVGEVVGGSTGQPLQF